MNKYQNGKIYKITSKQTDDVYIGSTIQELNRRFKCHKKNRCSSREIMKYDDAIIELIELYPSNSLEELLWRERYLFDNMECINIYPPIQTKEELNIKRKKMFIKYGSLQKKIQYSHNKSIRLEKMKIYYQFKSSHFGQLCKMF